MLNKIIRGLAPIAAMAMAAGVSGCDGMNININGEDGVPLAELETAGKMPSEVVLASPDTLIITDGDALEITVEGDQEVVDAMRFSLSDNSLGVMREDGDWGNNGNATVRVTMPSPSTLVMAGSGTMQAASLTGKGSVTIAGSGETDIAAVNTDSLDVTVAGSGTLKSAGTTGKLEMTIAGSGSAPMPDLAADNAEVTIAGSGSASFASDGKVDAKIMGSGNVTVTGSANCTIQSMGSGTLNCQTVTPAPDAPEAPEAPSAPGAPEAPEAPDAPGT